MRVDFTKGPALRLNCQQQRSFTLNLGSVFFSLALSIVGITFSLDISNPSAHCCIGAGAICFIFGLCACTFFQCLGFRLRIQSAAGLLIGSSSLLILTLSGVQILRTTLFLSLESLLFVLAPTADFILQRKTMEERVSIALFALGVGFLILYSLTHTYHFSPDSFAYFGIAKSFFSQFGDTGLIRQYTIPTDLNVSFPYFYPLLLLISQWITGLELYAGVILNIFIALTTSLLLLYLSKRLCGATWCGSAASAVLLTCPSYLDEVCAARAIPLAMLLTLLCVLFLSKLMIEDGQCRSCSFLIGLFAGMCASTRFDGATLAIFSFVMVLIASRHHRVSSIITCALGIAIPLLPWTIYSLAHFGSLWISDNSGTFLLVEALSPRNVNVSSEPPATLLTSPEDWLMALIAKGKRVASALLQCSYLGDGVLLCSVALLAVKRRREAHVSARRRMLAISILVFLIFKTMLYILVGYSDTRYHVETIVLLCFVLALLLQWTKSINWSKFKAISVMILCLMLSCIANSTTLSLSTLHWRAEPLQQVNKTPSWIAAVDQKLDEALIPEDAPLLVLNKSDEFYGWTLRKTYSAPLISNESTILEVLANHPIQYILARTEDRELLERIGFTSDSILMDLGDHLLFQVN